jgi:hypothetical protein
VGNQAGRSITITIALLAALAGAAGAPPSAAQEAPPADGAVELVRLVVRPGHEAEIERFLARLAEAARRTEAPVRWRVHRRVDGEHPLYVLVLRAPDAAALETWGDLTAAAVLERAYGGEEARSILALRETALEGLARERFVALPALDLGP